MNTIWLLIIGGAIALGWFARRLIKSDARTRRRGFPPHALPGKILRVTDGDGVRARIRGYGELDIRLAYIDAPEHDQPGGAQAKQALTAMTHKGPWTFNLLYRDRYARAIAIVSSKTRDPERILNEELVSAGHAWICERFIPRARQGHYRRLQREAQRARKGIWHAGTRIVAPWDWRRGQRSPNATDPQAGTRARSAAHRRWRRKLLRALLR